ncbi:MAG TPA: hypothetical protein VGL72_21965 [Bryobacteraceae bacterium]
MQRLIINAETGVYAVQYRMRSPALFTTSEWTWGSEKNEAFIFEKFSLAELPTGAYEKSAESHAATLTAQGEKHVHAVVWTRTCEEARAASRQAATAPRPRAAQGDGLTPFERMEKENLA